MRAIYCPNICSQNNIQIKIEGDSFHHLQVARVKSGEELLLLDGKGKKNYSIVLEISKKYAVVEIQSIKDTERFHQICLAISTPKRDAFWDILKIAVEMGVPKIVPLISEYSQFEFSLSSDGERAQRVFESALAQSNNAFIPEISSSRQLDSFLNSEYELIWFFNSAGDFPHFAASPNELLTSSKAVSNLKSVVLIGPEGGFSKKEIEMILQCKKTVEIKLNLPIMRSPTAVSASLGYLLASYQSVL